MLGPRDKFKASSSHGLLLTGRMPGSPACCRRWRVAAQAGTAASRCSAAALEASLTTYVVIFNSNIAQRAVENARRPRYIRLSLDSTACRRNARGRPADAARTGESPARLRENYFVCGTMYSSPFNNFRGRPVFCLFVRRGSLPGVGEPNPDAPVPPAIFTPKPNQTIVSNPRAGPTAPTEAPALPVGGDREGRSAGKRAGRWGLLPLDPGGPVPRLLTKKLHQAKATCGVASVVP